MNWLYLLLPPQICLLKLLMPIVAVFGDGVFMEVIKVKRDYKCVALIQ